MPPLMTMHNSAIEYTLSGAFMLAHKPNALSTHMARIDATAMWDAIETTRDASQDGDSHG
jgi:hypothetical protein